MTWLKGSATALCVALAVAGPARAQDGVTLIRDTEIEDILRKDAQPLFEAAGVNSSGIEILLIGSKDLQASAGPGTMAIYTGLILESKNPNELQGVIAHEVGHLAGGHSARRGDMGRAGMQPFLLTMGLGVLAAIAGAPEAAAGLAGSASYFGTIGALGYSREQESRTDQAGATYLEKAGLSGRGLVEFFDRFRYQEVFDSARRFEYFRSHPISSDRIEALRTRVEKQPHFGQVDGPDAQAEHDIMKAKLEGFLFPLRTLTKYLETDAGFPARYARAIAYYQTNEPDKALAILEKLLAEQPSNPFLWELKGQILFEFGRAAEAEGPQRRAIELKRDAPLLRINLGQTLISFDAAAKVDEGIAQLKQAVQQEDDNATAWRLLAEAYEKRSMEGEARLATAEQYYALGAKNEARGFAARARARLTRGSPEWRRATDIIMTSSPTREDLRELAQDNR